MRLGLVARSDNSGLGIQTHEFYKHMHPDRTMVVDISELNGNQTYNERYSTEDSFFVKGFPTPYDIDYFLKDLDVIFVAESPYTYGLYSRAKQLGVKVAVQYNYEFFDWFSHPDYPKPDMLVAPTSWHFENVQQWSEAHNVKLVLLRSPVNREVLPYREINKARTFLHIAGRSAAHDRNGTETVIEASRYVQSGAKIKIHFQGEQGLAHQTTRTTEGYRKFLFDNGDATKIDFVLNEYVNYHEIYNEGDVLLLPRRYGGNCLPMNEALSVGMPVIMTDTSPNRDLLIDRWLLPAERIGQFTPRTTIDIYGADPRHLARAIDRFYNMEGVEMLKHNVRASNIAEQIAWSNMAGAYARELEKLCTQ